MDKEPKFTKVENELSPEAHEIIALYQRFVPETNPEEQEKISQEFYRKLIIAVTPKGEEPHIGSGLHDIRGILLGKQKDNRLYIGSGTSGCRIPFNKYAIFPKAGEAKIKERSKEIKISEGLNNTIEVEDERRRCRFMKYYRPEGGDYKFGGRYWERYMETFGA